jgi:hypothetical protein
MATQQNEAARVEVRNAYEITIDNLEWKAQL